MPPPNALRPPPPVYDEYDSGDYLSDDDLSPNELNVLNTDYNAQADLNFHPTSHRHDFHHPSSSADLGTRPYRRPGDSEKQNYNGPLRYPPRLSSVPGGQPHYLHNHRVQAYPPQQQRRRPLIDYIKNEWAHTTSAPGATTLPHLSDDEWEFATPVWIQCCFAPKFQRTVMFLLAFSVLVWANWSTWLGPRYNEAAALKWSIDQREKIGDGWFGESLRAEFFNLIHVQTLDESFLPTEASDNRLIIIGDVHGCYTELLALLDDCQYSATRDHLVFTGDLIAKGPDSPAVVDLAIAANASCVRGNHEDRLLLAHRDMSTDPLDSLDPANKNKDHTLTPGTPSSSSPIIDEESFMHGDVATRLLARQLTPPQIAYLAACPVILDIGDIPQLGSVHVAHAGLVPGLPLTHQDPVGSMTMRTIDLRTHVPSSSPKGVAWWKLWNKFQAAAPTTARKMVLYGHDSKKGLNVRDHSIGLDSGCVKGGKLSAFVVEGGEGVGGSRVVSVPCQDYGDLEGAILKAYGSEG